MRKELPLCIFVVFCLLIGMTSVLAQLDLNERNSLPSDRILIGVPDDDDSDDECDDECDDYPAPVARTGQTMSYGCGDDGDLQKGACWPEPRFTDNLNGTVTDHLTGLVWLMDATRFSARGWNPALNACNNLADDGLALTDGSVAGDWRLPNSKELRRLIDFGESNPALPFGHPFTVPAGGVFWSSTTATNNTGRAWTIDDGTMVNDPKGTPNWVWPVRDAVPEDLGPAPVPKTGQIFSFGSRDDGELQKGVAWPDPRFTDNLNGTVTDKLTGLIWLQDATRFSDLSFVEALITCNTLADDGIDLTDESLVGDWRLPSVWELGSLTDFGEKGPALPDGHPFVANNAGTYWTSTTSVADVGRAWTMGLGIGKVSSLPKDDLNQVWPVRDCVPYNDDDDEDGDEDSGAFMEETLDVTGFGNPFVDLTTVEEPVEEKRPTTQDRATRIQRRNARPSRK
jgi:hypothetical protein